MNIGAIKKVLQSVPRFFDVYYDFCDLVPTHIESWRGRYDLPALGWDFGSKTTVADLLAELELATSGKVYHGHKGGEYVFTDNSQLHVDNPGQSSNTVIVMVEIGDYFVVLHTLGGDRR